MTLRSGKLSRTSTSSHRRYQICTLIETPCSSSAKIASDLSCNQWWESETDWHRDWKNRFPTEWQEAPMIDARTKERHIADAKTAANLVIEFQRSSIRPDEVRARENFDGKMIWVVDGQKMNSIE